MDKAKVRARHIIHWKEVSPANGGEVVIIVRDERRILS